jgi:hypothetical protein
MVTRLLFVALALLPLAAGAQAYRWVDEKGQVHYSQVPPPGAKTRTIVPPPGPSASPNQDALNKSLAEQQAGEGKRREEAGKSEQARAEREAQCRQAREQLAFMDANPPIRMTTTDDKGNVARVTEEQHRARRAELQKAVADRCS